MHFFVKKRVYVHLKLKKLISLSPQRCVSFDDRKFYEVGEVSFKSLNEKGRCFNEKWKKHRTFGEKATYFYCKSCNSEYHKKYEKAPLDIKHPLHRKHSLQLVLNLSYDTRECYCCDVDLFKVFYYCSICDYAMNIACVEKTPLLARDDPKWHDHTLALFPRQAFLTCNVCALADSSSPVYMCPPCDFVVHQKCLSLPRVIKISRHPHRISFTSSFSQGDWSCGVCRRKIDNDYGGYSCIKNGCLYGAHSRCATQINVWDGIDLEGEPEEIEEEVVEPFVRMSDGTIQHFIHDHHYLRLDENTCVDYDENKLCQACITPVYFGNFYSCVQCEFVLHETCASFPRKIYHPIHPHVLILAQVEGKDCCSACLCNFTAGFFYKCGNEDCDFQLHLPCATISEPFVHGSHVHPLYLTSKPGVWRECVVCQGVRHKETFNCIECDDFALCFRCATLPEKVRYKHDKHILTLSDGAERSALVYWCEICEGKIHSDERFYMCDEYCCVTLHTDCLIKEDLYMKPGSSPILFGFQVDILPNNLHMTRAICSKCGRRCLHKVAFQRFGFIFCKIMCCVDFFWNEDIYSYEW